MLVPHLHLNGHCREAMTLYEKEDSITIDELQETFYSPCVVGFLDRFGVRWGFMV